MFCGLFCWGVGGGGGGGVGVGGSHTTLILSHLNKSIGRRVTTNAHFADRSPSLTVADVLVVLLTLLHKSAIGGRVLQNKCTLCWSLTISYCCRRPGIYHN